MLNVRDRFRFQALAFSCLVALTAPAALAAEAAKPKAARAPAEAQTPAGASQVAGEVVSVEGVVFIRQDGRDASGSLRPARAGDPLKAGDVVNTSSNGKVKLLMKDKSIVDLGPSALFKVDHFAANGGTDRQVDVSMMYGTMRTAVTQKITGQGRFKVRTPTATMGVRGTEFVVKSEVRNLEEVRSAVQGKVLTPPPAANAPASPGVDGKPATPPPVAKTEITVIQGKVEVAKEDANKDKGGRKPSSSPQVVALTAGMQISSKQGDAQLAKPVTLDSKQLASLASVAKVQDNTFSKAVLLDVGQSKDQNGGPGGAGGIGEATKKAIEGAIAAAPPPPVIRPDSFGGPKFDPTNFGPRNTTAGMRRLKVIVVAQ